MCFQNIKLISIGVLLDWIAVWKLAKKLNQLFDAIQSALTHRKWATDSQFILQRFINSTIEPAIITIQWLNIWEFEYFNRIFGVCVCVCVVRLSVLVCLFFYKIQNVRGNCHYMRNILWFASSNVCITRSQIYNEFDSVCDRCVCNFFHRWLWFVGCNRNHIYFVFFYVLWNERKHTKSFN